MGPLGPVHRLRTIRARELALVGGALLGEGSFGKVQVGVWNGTDVAIKANGVDCRDPTAIDREREMWVPMSVVCVVLCGVWVGVVRCGSVPLHVECLSPRHLSLLRLL